MSMDELKNQLNELQDIVDIIKVTSKLLGYSVTSNKKLLFENITIQHPEKNTISIMAYITAAKRVRLSYRIGTITYSLPDESHQTKIIHLNNLLNKL